MSEKEHPTDRLTGDDVYARLILEALKRRKPGQTRINVGSGDPDPRRAAARDLNVKEK